MGKKKFSRDHKTAKKDQIPIILIVCEGEKTEPNYFKKFEVSTVKIETMGTGVNTINLVERAVQELNTGKYEQVWCVFDKDDFPSNNFNRAVQIAENNNIGVAYSNESFELWYVLHFEYLSSNTGRRNYLQKLNNHFLTRKSQGFPHSYEKKNENIYYYLKPYQAQALKYAEKLAQSYEKTDTPADRSPVTYVYKLVKELNKWIPSERLKN